MTHRIRWVVVALVLVLAGAVALWPRTDGPSGANPLPPPPAAKNALPSCARQGPPVPGVQGLTATCLADNSQVDVAQAFAGPVLVNIWATWCAPCQEELPVFAAYAAEPGAMPVVTVAVESEPSTAVAMLTNLDVRLPALLDTGNTIRRALRGPNVMPLSFVIDATGNVRQLPGVFGSVGDIRKAVGQ